MKLNINNLDWDELDDSPKKEVIKKKPTIQPTNVNEDGLVVKSKPKKKREQQ